MSILDEYFWQACSSRGMFTIEAPLFEYHHSLINGFTIRPVPCQKYHCNKWVQKNHQTRVQEKYQMEVFNGHVGAIAIAPDIYWRK
jgi:hypothetical protein